MSVERPCLAKRMLAMAEHCQDGPDVAYLCAWAAAEVLISSLAREAGVRPTFSLRQNGTLRTRRVDGLKVPHVVPPREDHLMRTALRELPNPARRRLVMHPSVGSLARRVPTFGGAEVRRDSFRQRLNGVMDLALTRDVRYPVWHGISQEAVAACVNGVDAQHVGVDLLFQIAVVLRTIRSNLMLGVDDTAEAPTKLGFPLVRILVEGWLEA